MAHITLILFTHLWPFNSIKSSFILFFKIVSCIWFYSLTSFKVTIKYYTINLNIIVFDPSLTFTCWLISFSIIEELTWSRSYFIITILTSYWISFLTCDWGPSFHLLIGIIKYDSLISKCFLYVVHSNTGRCKIIPFGFIVSHCEMIRSLKPCTSSIFRIEIIIITLSCSFTFLFIICICLLLNLTFFKCNKLNDTIDNI